MKTGRNFREIRYDGSSSSHSLIIEPVWKADVDAATRMQKIQVNAWSNSEWYKQASAQDLASSPDGPYRSLSSELAGRGRLDALKEKIKRSHMPFSAEKFYTARFSGTHPLADVGYLRMRRDVSGNHLARLAKRTFRPDMVYACIGDVNVEPDHQKRGVGTALVANALSLHPAERKVTTYVADNNQPLISKLEDLEFKITGQQERPELYGSSGVQEIRLEAPSVQVVRGIMHEMYPWLNQAQVS